MSKIREKDTAGFLAYWHPEAVIFVRDRLFPIDRSGSAYDNWAAEVQRMVETTISVDFVPKDISYRVIGDTGIVWGFSELRVDARSRPGSNLDSRFTALFSKVDGEWKIVAWHASAPPSGRER